VVDAIERGPCPLADPAYAALTVNFASVAFANLEAVPADTLRPAWQDMAGRELPLAALCEVRDRAATMLRRMGYLAAVQVPPQRIEPGGEVRMDVLVARLVDLQVRGDAGNAEQLIAAHLAPLTDRPYFNVTEAERHLLLARDLPGFDVRMTLRSAGRGPGEVIGEVVVSRQPVELIVAAQNLAAEATGREGIFAQIAFNDLLGLGDRTALSIYNTLDLDEQTVVQLSHDLAAGSSGLRFGGKLVYGEARPDVANGSFTSKTIIAEGGFTYPLIRRQALSLLAGAGIEAVDQRVRFGSVPLSEDRLRVLFARAQFDALDRGSLTGEGGYTPSEPLWSAGVSLEARHGIDALGASERCATAAQCRPPNVPMSDIFADPSALVTRLEGDFQYRPVPAVTIAFAPVAQYSPDRLLVYEQLSLGNYTVGRGFDPGIVQGDSGVGARFELQVGRLTPRSESAVTVQPFAFLDAAWAWNNDAGTTPDPQRVLSAGGGLRGRWGDRADASLTLAVPLERAGFQTTRGDARLLFTISTRLLPWRVR
jgi:hemolysin activation/secretion protein